jgi:hypothetical protein
MIAREMRDLQPRGLARIRHVVARMRYWHGPVLRAADYWRCHDEYRQKAPPLS